jgi:hypothetical protein
MYFENQNPKPAATPSGIDTMIAELEVLLRAHRVEQASKRHQEIVAIAAKPDLSLFDWLCGRRT